ncbi:hypothetical protein PCE1_002435 [Barthelona sp. PCE]
MSGFLSRFFNRGRSNSTDSISSVSSISNGIMKPPSSPGISAMELRKGSEMSRKIRIKSIVEDENFSLDDISEILFDGNCFEHIPTLWRIATGLISPGVDFNTQLRHKRNKYWRMVNDHFTTSIKRNSTVLTRIIEQIAKDMPRTQPNIPLFHCTINISNIDPELLEHPVLTNRPNDMGSEYNIIELVFTRILYLWSIRHPACGYVQGMDVLLCPFLYVYLQEYFDDIDTCLSLIVRDNGVYCINTPISLDDSCNQPLLSMHQFLDYLFDIESDIYHSYTTFIDPIQDFFTEGYPGIKKQMTFIEHYLEIIDPELHNHLFNNLGLDPLMYSFRWFNCLLAREFNIKMIVELWGCYFSRLISPQFKDTTKWLNLHLFVIITIILSFKKLFCEENLLENGNRRFPHHVTLSFDADEVADKVPNANLMKSNSIEFAVSCFQTLPDLLKGIDINDISTLISQAYVFETTHIE